eukprot:Nitzschia sp. Nitz4//scaffold337_size18511//12268//12981//NITZ4_008782-RA/size18511-processed-gene-0.13-mRNA-1//-1//CDS//3329548316//8691//frame0
MSTTSRKRVRFDSEESDQKRVKVEVLELLRPSSELTSDEKEGIWYHKKHFKRNIKSAHYIANIHKQTHTQQLNYTGALAATYTGCCMDQSDDWVLSEHCAKHLVVATASDLSDINGESNRGLEKVTVPMVGLESVRRRKEVVSSVLLAQAALKHCTDPASTKLEIVRRISEEQTQPAKRFAKALGTADAMLALLEYGARVDDIVNESIRGTTSTSHSTPEPFRCTPSPKTQEPISLC